MTDDASTGGADDDAGRKMFLSLNDTPYYHVVARCVRRAWLCGIDEYAGKDYSHRKAWIIERMSELSAVFAIDVAPMQ